MKTTSLEYAESPRLALWTALAFALGILLHRLFFLVALALVVSAPFGWLINWIREPEKRTTPIDRHA